MLLPRNVYAFTNNSDLIPLGGGWVTFFALRLPLAILNYNKPVQGGVAVGFLGKNGWELTSFATLLTYIHNFSGIILVKYLALRKFWCT